MFWENLSPDQQARIWEVLRNCPDVIVGAESEEEKDEMVSDFINRHNCKSVILELLALAY